MRDSVVAVSAHITLIIMEIELNTIATININRKKVFMLPAISEHTADQIYFIGNILLVVTAITAALGAIGVFWGDRVRDYYNDLRLSDNEKQIELTKLETAKANERAASADERAAKIQASVAPRRLSLKEQKQLTSAMEQFASCLANVWYGAGDKEAETFAWEIATALDAGRWQVFNPASIVTMAESGLPFGSKVRLRTGVSIVSRGHAKMKDVAQALAQQLNDLGFDANLSTEVGDTNKFDDMIVINVEARPEGPQGAAKLSDH